MGVYPYMHGPMLARKLRDNNAVLKYYFIKESMGFTHFSQEKIENIQTNNIINSLLI